MNKTLKELAIGDVIKVWVDCDILGNAIYSNREVVSLPIPYTLVGSYSFEVKVLGLGIQIYQIADEDDTFEVM